jgi:murein DD-endopeptidase MepM/ murein hydrolase activator NlpD
VRRILGLLIGALLLVLLLSAGAVTAQQAQATAYPTNTRRPVLPSATPTVSPSPLPTFVATPIPGPFGGDLASWTPAPLPSTDYIEYFAMARPIGPDGVNYPAHNYGFGSRDGGGRPTHHGDDYQNLLGTPVLAVAQGVVEYAGPDSTIMFGPQFDFYGNVVVIRHPFSDADGKPIFSLYGHLSKILVATGKAVKLGETIGLVGAAGVAVGAHLHLEVRTGDPHDYTSVRNPELWVAPFPGSGVIAGRVTDLYGKSVYGVIVQVKGNVVREAETYWDETVGSDVRLKENFVISDLPSGYYQVIIRTDTGVLKYRNTVYVRSGKVSVLEIHIDPS